MSCEREDELLDALGRGYVAAELESHLAACRDCAELRAVAGALLDERIHAVQQAAVPSAGSMWWRIQTRTRQDAAAAARRALLIGQAATLLIALALGTSYFGFRAATGLVSDVHALVAAVRVSTPLMIALAAWIVAAPIAGWAALRSK
ncbi:MAG TPA: hypothetical protein VF824_22435 [Thermoanaerobaculia bacterium]|jgi:hypothetical protein